MIKTIILQSDTILKSNPSEFLLHINNILQTITAGNFVTAFYGIYNYITHSIFYSCAGHPQPYIITNKTVTQLQSGRNTAIAMFPNSFLEKSNKYYKNYFEILPSNSKLLFYTDGLTEARKINSNIFYEDSELMSSLTNIANYPSNLFIEKLFEDLTFFRGSSEFEDDICLVCLDIS